MTLTLSPQLEGRIQEKLDRGEFANFEHLLVEALDRLDADDGVFDSVEMLAKIDEGVAALDRGESMSREELLADIARSRADERA